MKIVMLFSLLLSTSLFAFEFNSTWTKDFKKVNSITCSERDNYLCTDLCGKSKCEIEEKTCRNCIGNDPYVASLFSAMGKVFRNTGVEVSKEELFYFFRDQNFVAISSKSVFNNIETFNAYSLRRRFRSLCPRRTDYPSVLLELKKGGELGKIRYVICASDEGQQAFEMSNEANIIYNQPY